jgi:cytochrome c biogenesis protein CcmG/thiol:disulfide interchange protein DsbE
VTDELGAVLDTSEVPRRRRTGLVVSAVVAVVAIGFVAVLATREPATDRRADSPLVGKVVPALSGETLDGGSFDVDDQQGRWVVVNFFATWCVPCQQEHPELVEFDEAHRRSGDAVLVSVLFEDEPTDARGYFARNGGDWPVVVDDDLQIATGFGVPKVPETYVVAPNGRVVAKLVGGVTRDGLEGVIDDFEAAVDAAREGS